MSSLDPRHETGLRIIARLIARAEIAARAQVPLNPSAAELEGSMPPTEPPDTGPGEPDRMNE